MSLDTRDCRFANLADLLVAALRDLRDAEFERATFKAWFRAALDVLHEQHLEIERQRRQLAHQREQLRQFFGGCK